MGCQLGNGDTRAYKTRFIVRIRNSEIQPENKAYFGACVKKGIEIQQNNLQKANHKNHEKKSLQSFGQKSKEALSPN